MVLLIDEFSEGDITDFLLDNFDMWTISNILSYDPDILPNIIIYGHIHIGKNTFVLNFMKKLLNKEHLYTQTIQQNISLSVSSSAKKKVVEYTCHDDFIIIYPSGDNSDRYLIMNILDSISTAKTLKYLIVTDFTSLTFITMAYLRYTIDIYSNKCKFIFLADSIDNIPLPIYSRCIGLGLNTTSVATRMIVGDKIVAKKSINISDDDLRTIVHRTHTIHELLLHLDMYRISGSVEYTNSIDKVIITICDNIVNFANINNITKIIKTCKQSCIDEGVIIELMTLHLIERYPSNMNIIIDLAFNANIKLYHSRRNDVVLLNFIIKIARLLYVK